ncbi:conjugative transfer signal peptidase TraF [Fundidesulfovibrio putealis]|uniref:conjugative transfer signal peptidase TraF n=1 Tax=Fundidesulfovibrio putealis TaxID=270496 RepID=UPI000685464A|nr:conjugative transfer signal peptidase TraF [Fundidesulfovibrio putealis]KAF0234908.1 MAG: putative conjugative transfer signal peptidase [Desulfovibrionaceae bacterium]
MQIENDGGRSWGRDAVAGVGEFIAEVLKCFWKWTLRLSTIVLAFLFVLYFGVVHLHLRFNFTSSMPLGIYRVAPAGSPVVRGDYATFRLTGPLAALAMERGYLEAVPCPGVKTILAEHCPAPLLKAVAGVPGDVLEIGPDGIRVNGILLQESRTRDTDSRFRPMPESLLRPGPIAQGMALVMSDANPQGFDSRYFGLVSLAGLEKVQPVWTFGEKGDL